MWHPMNMRYNILLSCATLLAGCTIGPRYKKPEIPLPEHYSRRIVGTAQENDHRHWWQVFENPELEHFITMGLPDNIDLQIALEKIEEARNLYCISRAHLFPQINFFSQVPKSNSPTSALISTTAPNANPGGSDSLLLSSTGTIIAVDTLWELDIWGRLRRNKTAALLQWQAQIADLYDVSIMVAAEIAQTYIRICALQQKIQTVTDSLDLDTKIITLYQDIVRSGIEHEQTLLEQITVTDELNTQLINFTIDLQSSVHQLAYLTGKTPDQLFFDTTTIRTIPRVKREMTLDAPYELLRRRPDIRKAERLLAASYEEVGAAMAEWFPKIALLGIAGEVILNSRNLMVPNALRCRKNLSTPLLSAGPVFQWPIIDFGRIRFTIKAKESSQRQALLTYEKTVINAVKEVEDWLVAYLESQEITTLLSQTVETEHARSILTQDLFTSGLETKQNLLVSLKKINDVTLEHINAQEKTASNFVALYKALGGDW